MFFELRREDNRVAVGPCVLAIPWVKTQGYSWGIALRYSFNERKSTTHEPEASSTNP
ncbi:hypothetical protein BH11VER1_BH11VER1_41680 [soil metagenome]